MKVKLLLLCDDQYFTEHIFVDKTVVVRYILLWINTLYLDTFYYVLWINTSYLDTFYYRMQCNALDIKKDVIYIMNSFVSTILFICTLRFVIFKYIEIFEY